MYKYIYYAVTTERIFSMEGGHEGYASTPNPASTLSVVNLRTREVISHNVSIISNIKHIYRSRKYSLKTIQFI